MHVVTFAGALKAQGSGCCSWAKHRTMWGELKGVAGTLTLRHMRQRDPNYVPRVIRLCDYTAHCQGRVVGRGSTSTWSALSDVWNISLQRNPVAEEDEDPLDPPLPETRSPETAEPILLSLQCSHAWLLELEAWYNFDERLRTNGWKHYLYLDAVQPRDVLENMREEDIGDVRKFGWWNLACAQAMRMTYASSNETEKLKQLNILVVKTLLLAPVLGHEAFPGSPHTPWIDTDFRLAASEPASLQRPMFVTLDHESTAKDFVDDEETVHDTLRALLSRDAKPEDFGGNSHTTVLVQVGTHGPGCVYEVCTMVGFRA